MVSRALRSSGVSRGSVVAFGVGADRGVETTRERRARYPAEGGVPEDLLRVSVGCEHGEDLWQG